MGERPTNAEIGDYAIREHHLFEVFKQGKRPSKEVLAGLQMLSEDHFIQLSKQAIVPWIDKMIVEEYSHHEKFFGYEFDLTLFRKTLSIVGRGRVEEWRKMGLEVHFLPDILLADSGVRAVSDLLNLPGWHYKLSFRYWEWLSDRNLLFTGTESEKVPVEANLGGIVVLIDTRAKPAYNAGHQMFSDDDKYLGSIIRELRNKGKMVRYEKGPETSRFGISFNEWEKYIHPILVDKLGVKLAQVRMETAIESHIISQIYTHMPRAEENTKDISTWTWCEEFLESKKRQIFINSGSPAEMLIGVGWQSPLVRSFAGAIRPIVVLAKE